MTESTYTFGKFRLDPAARELRRDNGTRLDLPRLAFDGLLLLVTQRDRAVSRDELIEAVWGRSHVEDILVTQLISRLRRTLGDDSRDPRYIRTIPGFGYRWIAETREESPAGRRQVGEPAAGQALTTPARLPPRRWLVPVALFVIILVAVAMRWFGRPDAVESPLSRIPGEAVVVLPVEIEAASTVEAGWARLGIMDLVADRLRDSGLPVPPSDSVVSALHVIDAGPDDGVQSALRATLRAGVLVQGAIRRVGENWSVELVATTSDDDRRRVEGRSAEIIPAAVQAADRLLAALGRNVPENGRRDHALEELLQQAKAARLALELDTARNILTAAPGTWRDRPEVLQLLAWVEYFSGRFDEAGAIVDALLNEPDELPPRLLAEVLMIRGTIVLHDIADWELAAEYFDRAVTTLEGEHWSLELGRALARRGGARAMLQEQEGAVRDLGRARTLFEAGGDWEGLARVHNYLGILELQRRRPMVALTHFQISLEGSSAFGDVDGQRANLSGVIRAGQQLLRWTETLEAGTRLWQLRDRIHDPSRIREVKLAYARALIGMGEHREAETLLNALPDVENVVDDAVVAAIGQVLAQLRWQQGRPDETMAVALQVLTPQRVPDRLRTWVWDPAKVGLLYQRASLATGRPSPAADRLLAFPGIRSEPAYLIARAEWSAHQGDDASADRLFRKAVAESERWLIPDVLVLVSDAYARWLLAQGREFEALALAGRVADWATNDFDAALLQVRVFHAAGQAEAWAAALSKAQALAGEREIPERLLESPAH